MKKKKISNPSSEYDYLLFFYNISQRTKVLFARSYSQIHNFDKYLYGNRMMPLRMNHPSPKSWVDEYDFTLTIESERNVKITPNSFDAKNRSKHNDSKTMCSDLYNGLSMERLISISTKALVITGDYHFIIFYGIDNFIRALYYKDNNWEMISSLYFDMEDILFLINSNEHEVFQKFVPKSLPTPCEKPQAWLLSLPASELFFESFGDNTNIDAFKFLKDYKNGKKRSS